MPTLAASLVAATALTLLLALQPSRAASGHAVPPGLVRDSNGVGNWREIASRLGRSPWARRIATARLEERLDLAGSPWTLDVALGLKQGLGVVATLACLVVVLPAPATVLLTPIVVVAAFRLPDIALARKAKARRTRIADQVPDFAELLLVMTDAGVSPALSFRRAAEALPEPIGSEIRGVVRRLDLGVAWRAAVEDVAARAGVPALSRLARTLVRSQRLGTSMSSILRNLAGDLRRERRTQAEAAARRAPVKMLFPLVFLILPAFLLLTVGPVVLSTLRSLR